MDDDKTKDNNTEQDEELTQDQHSDYKPADRFDASAVHHLSGMYKNWFLDYASYVILERAVPHIEDGLKPVQRRLLHTMKRMDDGRYNKVANIVGETMKFHPHGDASIYDALVQLGQKDLLVDTQGNWGNILTGDSAAAPRYIEARLSKFALETVFNPKTTEWQLSYDGRNREPVTLPVKFPLLLAQGANGIAVGLQSKVLPHNFCEICDAAVSYLQGKEFHLYPDFPTGGAIDVARYNDGQRGGMVKVRARIEKRDARTLVISEIPYTKTATSLQDSITKAIEKGKIKARKVIDMTARQVEIQVQLAPGVSPDKTIDALYAFTDCEINISPNCCVIEEDRPQFLTISDVLRHSTDRTMGLLRRELQIRRSELEEQLFFSSLERIFIEERMYKEKDFEQAASQKAVLRFLDKKFEPWKPKLLRDIREDDYLRLLEIKMQRILKYNKEKADKLIAKINDEIQGIDHDLAHMVDVTIAWFRHLKATYGKDHPRLTEIRSFDTIEAAKVVEATEKLYINRQDGFIGTGLKSDEFVCNCSDLDEIIIFYRDGRYKVIKVADKIFVGKGVIWAQVFKRNDKRTIYNVVYRDGKRGPYYIKRFNVTSILRDREYDLTRGKPQSRVVYFTANPNGEAEVIRCILEVDVTKKNQKLSLERDFSEVGIKNRSAHGLLLTKRTIHRISLKSRGISTLGGRKVWFDSDVRRLNYEEHGSLLGEFNTDDAILVVLDNGEYYITDTDLNNHFEDNIRLIEKYDANKVWTAAVLDADNGGYLYLKRFLLEASKRHQNYLGDNAETRQLLLTSTPYPRVKVTFGGADAVRQPMEIDVEQFVAVKGFKAKGKRVANWEVKKVEELEPARQPAQELNDSSAQELKDSSTQELKDSSAQELKESSAQGLKDSSTPNSEKDPDAGKSRQQLIDEMTGQLNLFGDDN